MSNVECGSSPSLSPQPRPRPQPQPQPQPSQPRRVLACLLCQHRKVKCDRKYPCANCVKSQSQCVPAAQVTRPRRRRFPERELLERLRHYEDLLRQNNIKFEPLHGHLPAEKDSLSVLRGGRGPDGRQREPAVPGRPQDAETTIGSSDDDDDDDDNVSDVVVKKAWDQCFENNDHLLFSTRNTAVDLSTLHPQTVQIFRLWQHYLENVNPLFKVTHAPTLQGRIIEAASDTSKISPALEALMFSVYCISVSSLTASDCQVMLNSSKGDLLERFHFGCQQALSNCGFLRCDDRDCLTAFYLYLLSVGPRTVPQSLSTMLGAAIRIAQRMGLHSESALAKCTIFEAEMRRRLWWSLLLFDARIGEMANFRAGTLTPTFDCAIPLNLNESDLRPEMKDVPQTQGPSTDALFAVVRSKLGDFVRHTTFHQGGSTGSTSSTGSTKDVMANPPSESSELVSLEDMVQDNYLRFCDQDNPLHFMTIWTTRGTLAKCRLLELQSRYSSSYVYQAETQRDTGTSYALTMLECDTKLMTSPLIRGFVWFLHFYFPFPAYIQIVQHLKRRPVGDEAEQAWEIMSDNCQARFASQHPDDSPFFKIFAQVILQAWEVRKTLLEQTGLPVARPRIVQFIQHKVTQVLPNTQAFDTIHMKSAVNTASNDASTSMPMCFGSQNQSLEQSGYALPGPCAYPDVLGLAPLNNDVSHIDWSAMDWDLINASTGELAGSTGVPVPGPTLTQGAWTY